MGVQDGPGSATEQAYPAVPAPGPYPYQQQAQPMAPAYPPVAPAYPPVALVQPSAPPMTPVAAGAPVKPAAAAATTIIITDSRPQDRCCTCSAGWYLFGFGWILSLLWIIGLFLPLCTKKRSDAWAALASGIALLVVAIVIGLVMGLIVVPILYSFT